MSIQAAQVSQPKIEFTPKLHNGNNTNTFVKYKILTNDDLIVSNYSGGCACYSAVTYSKILSNWDRVETWFNLKKLPYSKETIINWTAELNQLGFPCYLDFNDKNEPDSANFTVKFADFTNKLHFNSTLQLIRCIWEAGICYVPDIYFQKLKESKNPPSIEEKFILLQESHRFISEVRDIVGYANTNHMITYGYYNRNKFISLKEYKSRLNTDYKKYSIYTDKVGSVSCLWGA